MWIKQFLIFVLSFVAIQCETHSFPDGFLIGSASAAYQIEGAWNEDDKGENIWDNLTHSKPDLIFDRSNGDVGADSYHKFPADVKAMKEVGFHHYRFSVSWSRIIPNISMTVNQKGLDYYSRLIDELIANKIEPIITLYHWDLPQYLQDLGGFADPMIVKHFEYYADVLYKAFGGRVKKWITFNEPWNFCVDGYGTGKVPPQVISNGVGEYLCSHYMLQSHAAAYHLYKNKYFSEQKGLVGITLIVDGYLPKNRSLTENEDTQKAQEFRMGWYAHPIFSKQGGYPQIMIDVIGNNSMKEGRTTSRLPTMSDEMKTSLRGSADFFGLNYYTTRLVEKTSRQKGLSWENDVGLDFTIDSNWKRGKSIWLFSVPQGLHDVIVWIKNNYDNPPVFITENGWSDEGELYDDGRIEYLTTHLIAISEAINKDKCNVIGYTLWSIIDNFEWLLGYSEKFGIYQVDVSSPTLERIAKKSVGFMKDVIKKNAVTSDAFKSGPYIGLFICALIIHKLIKY